MKCQWIVSVIAFVCPAGIALGVNAQDYDREARWRAEIEPSVLVGDVVDLEVDQRKVFSIFTEGARKDAAVVLVHGVGVHPDHGLIGKLRTQIAEAGYSTLSIQMPVLGKEITDGGAYAATFPSSSQRIDAAARWLRAKGYKTLALASHSMGAWMSNVYLETASAPAFAAWACIGITGKIGSTGRFDGPILDLTGEDDLKPVKNGAWLRKMKLAFVKDSAHVEIPGANHFYEGKEAQASAAIVAFFDRVLPKP